MFDNIIIVDNKIHLIKWIIQWEEEKITAPIRIMDKYGAVQVIEGKKEVSNNSQNISSENEKNRIVEVLNKRKIKYTIKNVAIPDSIKIYDGVSWTKNRNEAIKYINGIGEYEPWILEINKLKQELIDSDYKAIKYAEGIISDIDYEPIKLRRQELRDKINDIEKKL